MPRINLPQPIGKRLKIECRRTPKKFKGAFKFPHPLRKPPRLKGKAQNRGIKKTRK